MGLILIDGVCTIGLMLFLVGFYDKPTADAENAIYSVSSNFWASIKRSISRYVITCYLIRGNVHSRTSSSRLCY